LLSRCVNGGNQLSVKKPVKVPISDDPNMQEIFEEIPEGLKNLLSQMAEAGEDCIGLLILHDKEEGTWSYTTNLNNEVEVVDILNGMIKMIGVESASEKGWLN